MACSTPDRLKLAEIISAINVTVQRRISVAEVSASTKMIVLQNNTLERPAIERSGYSGIFVAVPSDDAR